MNEQDNFIERLGIDVVEHDNIRNGSSCLEDSQQYVSNNITHAFNSITPVINNSYDADVEIFQRIYDDILPRCYEVRGLSIHRMLGYVLDSYYYRGDISGYNIYNDSFRYGNINIFLERGESKYKFIIDGDLMRLGI